MFKDEAMKSDICKKAYVAPQMTVVECQGPNLLNGSDVNFNISDDEIQECSGCEFN